MSRVTTGLGPRVSLRTNLADQSPMHLFLDSNTTLTGAGTNVFSGAATFSATAVFTGAVDSQSTTTLSGQVDIDGGLNSSSTATFSGNLISTATIDQTALTSVFLSKQTTASYTSLTLADGEMSIGSVSVASATIYFRSGNTTYEFDAQASTVL